MQVKQAAVAPEMDTELYLQQESLDDHQYMDLHCFSKDAETWNAGVAVL